MIIKFFKIITKITPILLLLHIVMFFLFPSFLKYNAQATTFKGIAEGVDIVSENYSMFNVLRLGIKLFVIILFLLTIICALFSQKIISKALSPEFPIVVTGVCMLLNLIFLIIIKNGVLNAMYPLGDNAIGYWYYLIADILIIATSVVEFLFSNKPSSENVLP